MATTKTRHYSMWLQVPLVFLGALGIIWIVSAIGSALTTPQIPGWYATLQKPPLTPPSTIFGPAWTILYLLMAASVVIVWRHGWKKPAVERALLVFCIQLFFNLLWSVFFFGLQDPLLALGNIGLLWIAILFTIILFWHISRPAALLLVPYLAWVTFAAYLNTGIVFLNK